MFGGAGSLTAQGQFGRTLSVLTQPNIGATSEYEVAVPPTLIINVNIFGWWILTNHSQTQVALSIPGFTTNGLYRGGQSVIGNLLPWSETSPQTATLSIPLPANPNIIGLPFDLFTLDMTVGALANVEFTWSDNDLELTIGTSGCGSEPTYQPLYPVNTPQDPAIVIDTPTARITKFADRARRRHARDNSDGLDPQGQYPAVVDPLIGLYNSFGQTVQPITRGYDEWKDNYWEQRVLELEIEDQVAMGGTDIVFRWKSFSRLTPAEFRFFYNRLGEPLNGSTYLSNRSDTPNAGVTVLSTAAGQPSTNPNAHPALNLEWVYETVVTNFEDYGTLSNPLLIRPLQAGDLIEFEPSQFMAGGTIAGQTYQSTLQSGTQQNYYGTTYLYRVGEGLVPWWAKEVETNIPGPNSKISYKSYPVPPDSMLAGDMTLHYLYTGETTYRYKQASSNLSHKSSHTFFHGRRIHHTDFEDGTHSEANNPALAAHVGQLGPKFTGRSCISCHVNNGRSLLPSNIGDPLSGFVINVASDASGTPHPLLGDTIQSYSTTAPQQWQVETEIHNVSHGINVIVSTDPGDVGGQVTVYDPTIPGGSYTVHGNAGINLPATADYVVEFRYASVGGAILKIEENAGTTLHSLVTLPPTGSLQSWNTEILTVNLPAGPRNFAIAIDSASASSVAVNWFRISEQPSPGAVPGEGVVRLDGWDIYDDGHNQYADGTPYQLEKPRLLFEGTTPPFYSLRMAPQLVGLGLLEAVDESTIAGFADPCDTILADGISGRMSVTNGLATGQSLVGRFNWKGGAASLEDQIAYAFNRDMGVATDRLPTLDGDTVPSAPEVTNAELNSMARYIGLLGVNARRDVAGTTVGENLFQQASCHKCHVPMMDTGSTHPWSEVRGQTIHPYTDMLLHDMGAGLADTMSLNGQNATNSEWRTPPLWGIGLAADVYDDNGREGYLHDGRASSLEEAILWHGGEAASAKDHFRTMTNTERSELIKFLKSL
jgi:CxxC motif-containing protein (DUF1111 family)